MNNYSAEISPPIRALHFPWRAALRAVGYVWPLLAVVVSLWRAAGAWSWQHGVILLAAAAQIGLYHWLLAADDHPDEARSRLTVYALGASGLWLVQSALDPGLAWFSLAIALLLVVRLSAGWALLGVSLLFAATAAFLVGGAGGSMSAFSDLAPLVAGWAVAALLFLVATLWLRLRRERMAHQEAIRAALANAARARDLQHANDVLHEQKHATENLQERLRPPLNRALVHLERVQRALFPDRGDAIEHIAQAQNELHHTLSHLGALAGAAGLGERSLYEGVDDLCVQFTQQTGILVELMMSGNWRTLSPAIGDTLWRVVDAALASVVDAGDAQRVAVRTSVDGEQATVSVTAERTLASAEPSPSDSSTLARLDEAAALIRQLDGTLECVPRVGGGNTISATLPLV